MRNIAPIVPLLQRPPPFCDACHEIDVTITKKLFNNNKMWAIQLVSVILLAIKIVLKSNMLIKHQIGITKILNQSSMTFLALITIISLFL